MLAERIALGWRARAAVQFPDRPIVVEVVEESEDDGPAVLMYTRRAPGGDPAERAGIPTPRVQEFDRCTDPSTGEVVIDLGRVRCATADELAGLI